MILQSQQLLALLIIPLVASVVAQSQAPLSISTPLSTNVTGIPQGVGGGSGQPCDPRKSVLDGLTHRFRSDCNATEWCSPTPVGAQALNQSSKPLQASLPDPQDDEEDDPNELIGERAYHGQVGDGVAGENVRAKSEKGKDGSSSVKHSKPQPQPHDQIRRGIPPLPSTTPGIPLNLPTAAAPTPSGAIPTTGICVPKKCRRDEYPFGYKGVPAAELPQLCGPGTYCPDEESACKPLIPLGGSCQLNRDDSCAQSAGSMIPPHIGTTEPLDPQTVFSRSQKLMSYLIKARQVAFSTGGGSESSPSSSSNSDDGFSSNSSIAKPLCLGGTCRLASATLGSVCVIDHTQYLGYDQNGEEVADVVSRDDCRDTLYCDSESFTCMKEKEIGQRCKADAECLEYNCSEDGYCDPPPEAPNKVPGWAFGLIGVAISLVIITIVTILYKVHLNHRAIRSDEIDRYFSEQWTYRQSILAMHAAAISSATAQEPSSSGSGSSSRAGVGNNKSDLHSRKGYGYISEDGNRNGNLDGFKPPMTREDSELDPEIIMARTRRRKDEKEESGYESDQSDATTIVTPTNQNAAHQDAFIQRQIRENELFNQAQAGNRRKPPPSF